MYSLIKKRFDKIRIDKLVRNSRLYIKESPLRVDFRKLLQKKIHIDCATGQEIYQINLSGKDTDASEATTALPRCCSEFWQEADSCNVL